MIAQYINALLTLKLVVANSESIDQTVIAIMLTVSVTSSAVVTSTGCGGCCVLWSGREYYDPLVIKRRLIERARNSSFINFSFDLHAF